MEKLITRLHGVHIAALLLLLLPAASHAQSATARPAPPPVEQELVREGDLAVKLIVALGVDTTEDEVEAESRLGDVGIVPRNGWVADYPVTPDIIGELQQSIIVAADRKKLSMSRDEAVQRLHDVTADLGVEVKPYTGTAEREIKPPDAERYPDPEVINNYYSEEGPPVVTYYSPPPDYYYLYDWVPYSFWWGGFWYPGFFCLHDFHQVVTINGRVRFISNHFNDVRRHRVFRIDPVLRSRGRTYAGIGASRNRGFVSTGVPRSDRTIFNGSRRRGVPGDRSPGSSIRDRRSSGRPSATGRVSGQPTGGRGMAPPAGGVRNGGGRSGAPAAGGVRSGPSGGGRSGAPAGGGHTSAPSGAPSGGGAGAHGGGAGAPGGATGAPGGATGGGGGAHGGGATGGGGGGRR